MSNRRCILRISERLGEQIIEPQITVNLWEIYFFREGNRPSLLWIIYHIGFKDKISFCETNDLFSILKKPNSRNPIHSFLFFHLR